MGAEQKGALNGTQAAVGPVLKRARARKTEGGAPLPFEAKLWNSADKMRGQVEEAEYKHIVLGLIFLKYISDAFDHRRAEIASEVGDPASAFFLPDQADRDAALEDRDYYVARSVAWVPAEARWEQLQVNAKSADIGLRIDAAMDTIERANHELKGVLPKTYARPEIPSTLLGQLIDLFSKIGMHSADASEDILGRVYEYFLGRFGANEGGQFYTPRQVVQLLVEMLEPYRGRIFDPACGSGGMFVQSAKFVDAHGGRRGDIRVFGQEAVATTWRLAKMNLAIRHMEADLGASWADSFHDDRHKDLRADFVIANPPFNLDEWGGERLRGDPRWVYGDPAPTNANFAWVQHFLYHLAPTGTAGFVLANGSLTSRQNGEGEIRRRLVEDDLVDCIVALPSQLFFKTGIAVSLWFLAKNRNGSGQYRSRPRETLFIDARSLGHMVTRAVKALSNSDVERIARTYRRWRSAAPDAAYEDEPGFARAATVEEIAKKAHVLNPGDYVSPILQPGPSLDLASRLAEVADGLASEFDHARELEERLIAGLRGAGVAQEEWTTRRLSDVADIQFGFPFASSAFNTTATGMPLIRIRDLGSGLCSAYTTEDYEDAYVVRSGDLIVGMDGEFRPYIWRSGTALLNQRVCRITPKAGRHFSALLQSCLVAPLGRLERAKMGTTVIHLNKRDLDEVEFPWPDEATGTAIADLVDSLSERRAQAEIGRLLDDLEASLRVAIAAGRISVADPDTPTRGVS